MDLETALSHLPPSNPVLPPAYWEDPDESEGDRRPSIRSRGSSRVTLSITAGNRMRLMHVESALEYKWACVFDGLLKPLYFVEQPEEIKYIDIDGVEKSKRFDFFIMTSRKRSYVEIKPAYKVRKYGLETKFIHIASQLPKEFADDVLLLTDEDLHSDTVYNAQLLRRSRRYPVFDFEDALVEEAHDAGVSRIQQLVSRIDAEPGSAFVAIHRLIDQGRLLVQDEGRITHRSRVAAADVLHTARAY